MTLAVGLSRRIGVVVAKAIVMAGLVMLAGCRNELLYANLEQRQANDIVMTLKQHGIGADRNFGKGDRVSVMVDGKDFSEAMTILNDNGLPRQEFQTLGDVFKRDGLVSTPVQERAQMIYALSQELSKTVSDIDGVLEGRVHLVLPENDPLRQQSQPSSASVFIRYRANVQMDNLVPQIKTLVANGVAGLSYEKVSVVLVPVQPQERVLQRQEALRGGSLVSNSWQLPAVAGVAFIIVLGFGFVLWRHRRVYPLPPSQLVKS